MKTRSPRSQSHRSRRFSGGSHLRLTFALLIAAALTACTTDDADTYRNMQMANLDQPAALFDGEWTVDRQLVDTARLEVSDVLKVRLPESYLTYFCFGSVPYSIDDPSDTFTEPVSYHYTHEPITVSYQVQGYSENTQLYLAQSSTYTAAGQTLYIAGSYELKFGDVSYRVSLISDDPPTIIHRLDTDLWTIAITIRDFHITNLNINQQIILPQHAPLTLYYNATRRIR